MAYTVVPLHNLALPTGTVIPFGKFTLQDVPEWLRKEPYLQEYLGHRDRQGVSQANHALVATYDAEGYGHPDPEWQGAEPKGIQSLRWQAALLANMSLWMIMPSTVCLTCGFHALTTMGSRTLESPIINAHDHEATLYCHERDLTNKPSLADVKKAAILFETLSTVPRKNAVWAALRAFWGALVSYPGDMRYPLFWQGLESLFGSDTDTNGVSKRLRDRISYFLADSPTIQAELHDKVQVCYAQRSAIVHGRWEDSKEFHDNHMYTTEAIVRTVTRHIASRPGMLGVFLSPKRNQYLESWVRSRVLTPPPIPT